MTCPRNHVTAGVTVWVTEDSEGLLEFDGLSVARAVGLVLPRRAWFCCTCSWRRVPDGAEIDDVLAAHRMVFTKYEDVLLRQCGMIPEGTS